MVLSTLAPPALALNTSALTTGEVGVVREISNGLYAEPLPNGYSFVSVAVDHVCAIGPLIKLDELPPLIVPVPEKVSRFVASVVNFPLVKVKIVLVFIVLGPLSVTPAALLMFMVTDDADATENVPVPDHVCWLVPIKFIVRPTTVPEVMELIPIVPFCIKFPLRLIVPAE